MPEPTSSDDSRGATATPTLLAAVADTLAWPMLLLHADGELVHANTAAHRALDRGDPLRLADRRVQAAPASAGDGATSGFAAALRAAAAGQRRVLPCSGGNGCIALAPLQPAAMAAAAGGSAAPVLCLLTSADTHTAACGDYARSNGLDAAEAAVLVRLARGDSTPAIARSLGLDVGTVRRRIVSLRRKTRHASVADLLLTLARLPPLWPPAGCE